MAAFFSWRRPPRPLPAPKCAFVRKSGAQVRICAQKRAGTLRKTCPPHAADKTPRMSTTITLADVIPAQDLARAAKLAMDTLVSILEDTKAKVNERRIAALAILKLVFPATKRTRDAGDAPPPRRPASPAPIGAPPVEPIDARSDPPTLARAPQRRAQRLVASAGASP